ncbi:EAL domain-containing protein [Pseudarthrobacter sp. N5]|uniref:EAL domain-containing protein n=1 Tax=Pseudarthrobacter sp. N5 TaxID=3418416 RepID=UPI003CEE631D
MNIRTQAWGIISSILADPAPDGAAARQRLCEHLTANAGVPERALLEHLLESRGQVNLQGASTLEAPGAFTAPPFLDPLPADVLESPQSLSRISEMLSNRMLMTAFQPVHGLADGIVIGVEALSRFVSDDGASADFWFTEAASVGLGADLEFSALGSALTAAEKLPPHLYVALNLSPASCISSRLPHLFEQSQLPLNRIVLELTEAIEDHQYPLLLDAITPLRELGLRIAIDDADSGFGSMSRVLHLKPDFIKLGRSVIDGVDVDAGQHALAASMVEFATQIGAVLVAEGIETSAELAALSELGITAGQGYLLGRPSVRPEEWSAWDTAAETLTSPAASGPAKDT